MIDKDILFSVSPETAALVDVLKAVPYGEMISYQEIAIKAGAFKPSHLASARNIVARDNGAVFAAVRGIGLRRLTSDEAHNVGANARSSIRRKANRSIKMMLGLVRNNNSMDDNSRKRISAEIAHNGLLAHMARDAVQEKIAASPILADHARADARLYNALMKESAT